MDTLGVALCGGLVLAVALVLIALTVERRL